MNVAIVYSGVMESLTISQLFEPRVYGRGEAYWREDRVEEISQIAPGVFHGEVRGTSLYDVAVRVQVRSGTGAGMLHSDAPDWNVLSCTCTCPSAASGHRCKHCAAVLVAMEQGRLGEKGGECDGHKTIDADAISEDVPASLRSQEFASNNDGPGPIPDDDYRAVIAYCSAWYGDHVPLLVWDSHIAEDCSHIDSNVVFPPLSLQKAGRMAEGMIQSALEFAEDRGGDIRNSWDTGDDRDGGWDGGLATDADLGLMTAFSGVNDVLDNALATDDYAAAIRNALAVMRIADDAAEYLDSLGDVDGCLEQLGWKVRLLMEKAARDIHTDEMVLMTMAERLVSAVRDCINDQRSFALAGLASGLLSFSSRSRTRRIADTAISDLEHVDDSIADSWTDSAQWRSYLYALRHDDLTLANEYDKMRRHELDHPEDGMMTKFAVARAMRDGDCERVRELVSQHMAARPNNDAWRDTEILPTKTFPYGWTTFLIAVAQHLGDRNELELLYQRIIAQGGAGSSWLDELSADCDGIKDIARDKECVDKLKALVGITRWRDETLSGIIREWQKYGDENRTYEYLLQSEHLTGQALEYCARVSNAIDRLYDFIAVVQPDQATELLLRPYAGDHAFVGTVSRTEYRKVADHLRRAVPFMGTAWVAVYARSLCAKYPRRANLKAALRGLM